MTEQSTCNTILKKEPERSRIPSRRTFIKHLVGGTAVFAAAPYISCGKARNSLEALKDAASGLSAGSIGD